MSECVCVMGFVSFYFVWALIDFNWWECWLPSEMVNRNENCDCEKQRDQCSIYQMKLTRETKWNTRSKMKVNWPLRLSMRFHCSSHSQTQTQTQTPFRPLPIQLTHKSPLHFRPFDCAFSRFVLIHTCIYKFQTNLIVKQRLLSECYFSCAVASFSCVVSLCSSDNIRRTNRVAARIQ